MPFMLAVIFALIGLSLAGSQTFGLLAGALLGWLIGTVLEQRTRLNTIATTLERLQASAATQQGPPAAADPAAAAARPAPSAAPPQSRTDADSAPRSSNAPAARPAEPSDLARLAAQAFGFVRSFLVGGNPVVRIGVLVLFIGVAFLLRYATEHFTVSIELRLAGIAAGAIVMLVIGWRLRHRRDAYGLILQGGAVGVLYLTVFAAARLYGVVPVSGALSLMVAIVFLSTVLAVLQNAQALAGFAVAGGFLAPVLMSTGTGSHVALFSYFALLNASILGMAWFRSWRAVNWIGFVFTFGIGALWGYRYYQSAYFSTTEPFLVLFFLYYVAVGLLFTRSAERPRQARVVSALDGTLVFGTPIAAFALQAALVRDMEFALAYSALFVGAVYIGLAAWLKRQRRFSSLLGQSYLALGIVFASLALPFAFDNQRWTGAAWALEGAGVLWVGLRQQQLLPRCLGVLLQAAAGVALVSMVSRAVEPRLLLNSVYLGCLMLSLAGLFSAFQYRRHASAVRAFEMPLAGVLLGWGLLWWFAGGVREVAVNLDTEYRVAAGVLFVTLSFSALIRVALNARWSEAAKPALAAIPIAGLLAIGAALARDLASPLTDGGWLAWPLGLALLWRQLWSFEHGNVWRRQTLELAHALALATLVFVLTWTLYAGLTSLDTSAAASPIWRDVLWGLVPASLIAALPRLRQRVPWPLHAFAESYQGLGLAPLVLAVVVWLLGLGLAVGDPAPLPYVPILNPVALAQIGALLALYDWSLRQHAFRLNDSVGWLGAGVAALAFVWMNTVAARAVHFYGEVPYPIDVIAHSAAFQATISILWTLTALTAMAWGSKRVSRSVWLAGAALLAVVIVKLFVVDLSDIGTVARIVSFVSVGVLMLVIGYLAPAPPKRDPTTRSGATGMEAS